MVGPNKGITKNAESGKFEENPLFALFPHFEIILAQDSNVFQKATLSRIITLDKHEPSVTRFEKRS